MPFIKIIVAGSTGCLADHALPAILNSTEPKFEVTVLTRADSGKIKSIQGASVVPVDYDDHPTLVRAVTGADAIVSLVSGVSNKVVDQQLLAAAQEAGVRRIFPSEYTVDVLHPVGVSLLSASGIWPDTMSPIPVARKFMALANKNGPTSFTTIIPSAFIDGWLEGGFSLFEPKRHRVTLIDGGDHYFTGCSLPFLAACIVAVLKMDEERTKNKRIHISEVRTTMNEIVSAYEEVTGTEFEKISLSAQAMMDQRDDMLKSGDLFPALFVSIQIAAFGGCGAGDLVDGLHFDGDSHLSVPRKNIKQITAEAAKKVSAA